MFGWRFIRSLALLVWVWPLSLVAQANQCPDFPLSNSVDQLFDQIAPALTQYADLPRTCLFPTSFFMHRESTPKSILKGQQRPTWAQEYVGLDLAAQLLRENAQAYQAVEVGVLDAGFEKQRLLTQPASVLDEDAGSDDHGTLVTNLIADQPSAHIVGMGCGSPIGKGIRCIREKGEPRLFNISLTLKPNDPGEKTETRPDIQVLQNLIDEGTLLVLSAGNHHPKPVQDLKEHLVRKNGGVIIGSMSPLGYPSDMSQQSSQVFINAPSDYSIMVPYSADYRIYEKFGGTSGAAPIVTAGFSYPLAVLPGLSNEDLLELMKRTVLPTPNFYAQNKRDGQGTLNAYKALRVALKIREACQHQLSPKSCMSSAVRDESFYKFEQAPEQQALLASQLQQVFPRCGTGTVSAASIDSAQECELKRSVFKRLRENTFLNPMDQAAWKQLSCIYRLEGYEVDATFYERMSERHDGNIETLAQLLMDPNVFVQKMAVWALVKYGAAGKAIVQRHQHANKLDPMVEEAIKAVLDSGFN